MASQPILVTGKSGQLARSLHDWAVIRNIPMVLAGRPHLDVGDRRAVDRFVGATKPRLIVNTAAYTAVDKAEDEADLAFRINRDGAGHVARIARRENIPLIHISTDYVFDGAKQTPYVEDDAPAPLNVYGLSKLEGERRVLECHPDAIVIRASWVYGPYGHNFLRTMLRLAETQSAIKVVDDQHGTPTSSRDLASGIVKVIERLNTDPGMSCAGIYHLTNRGETTWHGFTGEIFRSLSRRGLPVPKLWPIKSQDYPVRARRPRNSCLDTTKIERVFGVSLGPWREAMQNCLDELVPAKETQSC